MKTYLAMAKKDVMFTLGWKDRSNYYLLTRACLARLLHSWWRSVSLSICKNSLNFNRTFPSVYRSGFGTICLAYALQWQITYWTGWAFTNCCTVTLFKNPLMMLDKINTDKPVLEPQLTELLPIWIKRFLINETFYPQLVAELKNSMWRLFPLTTAHKRQMNYLRWF